MIILVTGDLTWTDRVAVRAALIGYGVQVKLLDGNARGADTLAHEVAKELGYETERFQAEWGKFGRAAGPMRNKRMLDQKPDLVIAFNDDNDKGTRNMIEQAKKAGVTVYVVRHTMGSADFDISPIEEPV